MISSSNEFFSSPYYFFLKERKNDYNLFFSVEETITEARKKDKSISIPKDKLGDLKKYISKLVKSKKKKSGKEVEGEIEELVNLDGALMNSKIPILDPKMHPRKTMDQTVSMARQTNDPIMRGYRTYYGESIEGEVKEIDMSDAFGYEETKDMNGKETFKYFKDELDMGSDEAKERTVQQGKDPSGKKDKKSKYKNDPNFVTRATLSEIQRQKMIKVLEDMITNKKSDDSDIAEKNKSIDNMPLVVKRNLKSLMKHAEKNGISKKELVKLIQSE